MKNFIYGFLSFLAASAIFGIAVMLTYNQTIPELFPGANEITWLQGIYLKWFGDCVFRDIKLPKKQEDNERK